MRRQKTKESDSKSRASQRESGVSRKAKSAEPREYKKQKNSDRPAQATNRGAKDSKTQKTKKGTEKDT